MISAAYDLEHRNGLWWHDAPIPSRWHRCRAWTAGWFAGHHHVERCACGATRLDWMTWTGRNSRRDARKATR